MGINSSNISAMIDRIALNHQEIQPVQSPHIFEPRSTTTSLTPSTPYYSITDIDSNAFILDFGVNHITINDAKLLSDLKPSSNKVKGVGGCRVRIVATGKLNL